LLTQKILPPGFKIITPDAMLHLNRSGPKTDVSVLIEAGATCSTPYYTYLERELAKQVQVYSYDRAGLGWSECSKNPRDAKSIAKELCNLLEISGINEPLVLVGHSIASLYLRVFSNIFNKRIAAIILLDPSNPNQEKVLGYPTHTPEVRRVYRKTQWLAHLGLAGLINPLFTLDNPKISSLPEESKQQLSWIHKQAKTYITSEAEIAQFENSAKQALAVDDFGDLPLKVITGPDRTHDGDENLPIQRKRWMDLQTDVAGWSSCGEHTVIEEAGHMTLFTEKRHAQRVAKEILEFCKKHGFNL